MIARLGGVRYRALLFVFVGIAAILLCNCGTVASVAAPVAIAVATKNTTALASGAGAAFANKAISASVNSNSASFQNRNTVANVGPGGTQAQFNNGNISARANITNSGGQTTAGRFQTMSTSSNTMTIEFIANNPTGWQALQNYRKDGWNIINYEVTSYGAVRFVLFKQRQ